MGNEYYNFKLNNFERKVSSYWKAILLEEKNYDVTLFCDDNQIKSHQVILIMCSTVFKMILDKNSHKHPVIYLRGVKYKDLRQIINFIYQGEVNIDKESVNDFFAAAEDLKIKGLTEDERKEATSVSRSEPNFFETRNISQVNESKEIKYDVALTKENEVEHENDFKETNEVPNNRRKSLAWKYFTDVKHVENTSRKNRIVQCNICEKKMKLNTSSSTSSLLEHLKNYHNIKEDSKKKSILFSEEAKLDTNNEPLIYSSEIQSGRQTVDEASDDSMQYGDNRRSKIWKYFKFMDSTENASDRTRVVQCNICEKKINFYVTGSTTHLHSHIQNVHNIRLDFKKKNIQGVGKIDINRKSSLYSSEIEFETNVETKPSTGPVQHATNRRSSIWKYFSFVEKLENTPDQNRVVECNICEKRMNFHVTGSTSNLRVHIENTHNVMVDIKRKNDHIGESAIGITYSFEFNEFVNSCDKCDFRTTEKEILIEHVKAIHEYLYYPCDYCEFTASSTNNLLEHTNKHHNELIQF